MVILFVGAICNLFLTITNSTMNVQRLFFLSIAFALFAFALRLGAFSQFEDG